MLRPALLRWMHDSTCRRHDEGAPWVTPAAGGKHCVIKHAHLLQHWAQCELDSVCAPRQICSFISVSSLESIKANAHAGVQTQAAAQQPQHVYLTRACPDCRHALHPSSAATAIAQVAAFNLIYHGFLAACRGLKLPAGQNAAGVDTAAAQLDLTNT